eukprot:58813-Amphidinium_carterae.1
MTPNAFALWGFVGALAACGLKCFAYRQPADGGLFSMLDLNGDGVITRSEFAAAVGASCVRAYGVSTLYMPANVPIILPNSTTSFRFSFCLCSANYCSNNAAFADPCEAFEKLGAARNPLWVLCRRDDVFFRALVLHRMQA